MRVLFITHDGLTDHIGQSQVLPYLYGLVSEGFEISIVSAEKPRNAELCHVLASQLESAGIDWHYVSYHNKPPLISTFFDLCRIYFLARTVVCKSTVGLVHCRGFLPMFVGLIVKRLFGIPIIFDFRDFWADRRLISSPYKFVYRFFKKREGWMIRSADHIVTLTEKARNILQQAYLSGHNLENSKRFTVIPTCADFSLFDTRGISDAERRATRKDLGISSEDIVLGYLGTIHPDYMPEAIFRTFFALRSIHPNAKFLLVSLTPSNQIMRYAGVHGFDKRDVIVVPATRLDVPRYIAAFDFSVVFIRPDISTAGVSPTKLNELFACNVPVIANAGVGDLDNIIKLDVNDSVLVQDFSQVSLVRAINVILTLIQSPARKGRESSIKYSLVEGVRRYGEVYSLFVQPKKNFKN